ncbi:substrate-binding and VWA domain-containing protein [Nocardia sp. NBC_01503]|uniref:substrate-binding domain-containing protein n=1 Tax=Nocardia sp. NBC_01503 TaxID=2975997 RepID=UPI002E7ADCAF|nr:substrate-binding domain-containing protein [Nocardia sp. NBC_01503]WTL31793.1 substrate-binding and VWA domain-containing protein [Nocardia sp. NBC_01503]
MIVLALAVIGWAWFQERAKERDSAAAASCVEGTVTLNVTVDPGIVAPVRAAAESYNNTTPHVRDHCAQVAVNPQSSAAMIAAFTSTNPWDPALGPQPGLWIPDSTRSVELMRVPGLIGGTPAPIAVSPIALAVPDQLRQAMETAQVHWADLAKLQQGSLSDIGLAPWGGLKLAMPAGDSALAVATAVGSGVSGTDPLDENAVRSGQVTSAISLLAAGAPPVKDTATALADLAAATDPVAAPVHAVPANEQQIRAHNGLTVFRPSENGPVDDFPAAAITAAWVDQTQAAVAGLFADFLRAPEQSKLFTDNGFGAAPPNTATVPDKTVLNQVQQVLSHPVLGVSSTVLLDTSSSMGTLDGAMTRLANAVAALQSTMGVMPPEFGLGIWEYSKNLDGATPYKMVTPTAPLTDAQRGAIAQSLGTITPGTSKPDRTYPSVAAAYRNAVSNYASARSNTILLITDGPEDDSPVTGDQLLADIAAAADPAHPVRVDVIVINGPGTQTLQTLTQRTGGTYTKVASSNDLAFGTAVSKDLTTP